MFAFFQIFPNLTPVNAYGPTEVTAVAVHYPFQRGFQSVVIGSPDANMHAYVVDAALRPVPVGVPGELLLSGPRLALGYAGRSDLTEEKFIPNPCLEFIIERMDPSLEKFYQKAYRTGDLVRWRNDGMIDFLGRIDRQVKITGVRIELGEVESALEGLEGVDQAVVAAVVDPNGKLRLVGYVTPDAVDPASIIAHCRSLLVPAMVPSVVVALGTFPLMPNGKVDVRALPEPDWSGAGGSEEYVGPANEVETAVQNVFAEVLGRAADELSVLADFFAAGGTSLQVFRAIALLQEALGIASVPATMVHTERTPRAVAAVLSTMLESGDINVGAGNTAAIPARTWPENTRPLSFNQEQMWLLSGAMGASAYNMPKVYELTASPDIGALRASFDAVAARHEVLRTRFLKLRDGTVVGTVLPAEEFHVPVEVATITSLEEEVLEVSKQVAHGFDLEGEPLVRARLLIRAAPEAGAVLVITMHHGVGDAWALGIFAKELTEAYAAALDGTMPSWTPLAIQYADYAAWQRDQLVGELGADLRAYWKTTLSGAPSLLQMPLDHHRPAHPTYKAGSVRTTLPAGLLPRLEDVARTLRVNAQAVLLAGFQAVLMQYSGQDDVVLGVPVAGRDRPETHDLMGYFINTLPVRCIASETATFADLIRAASAATLSALDNGMLPLEEVIAAANVERVPNANPLFQVLFQYLPSRTIPKNVGLKGIGTSNYEGYGGLAHAKMDLNVMIMGNDIILEYMAELFDNPTMQRFYNSYMTVLEQIAHDVDAQALKCNLLGREDAEEVAALSMGVQRPEYLKYPLAHEAFEAMAAKFPDNQCLWFDGVWLTYAEVDARSSALAAQLAGMGVGPGVVVGVMLERSFDLVISILSVLKAGGCYLPLDPSYPDDRLAVYLEDANAVLVLIQGHLTERAKSMVGPSVPVIDVTQLDYSAKAAAITKRAGPEDPCYIIFTSGSTGRPKGVMLPHRGVRDLLPWLGEEFKLSANDVVIFSNTINFDAHVIQASYLISE